VRFRGLCRYRHLPGAVFFHHLGQRRRGVAGGTRGGASGPALASPGAGLLLNAFAHIEPAVTHRTYNPGLVTAVVLFLPLSLWTFRVALARYQLGWRGIIATIAAGIVLHAVLMGSLMAYLAGRIGVAVLNVIQVLNPALAGAIVYAVTRRRAP
jgi:hypothetical protein